MDNKTYLCELTKIFWGYYLLEPSEEHFNELFANCAQQIVLMGTGKHELYLGLAQTVENMKKNQIAAEYINFKVIDEWYDCLEASQDVYIVYGGIWVRQCEVADNDVTINMDSRFSFTYRKNGEKWEILHIHHSIPYIEQQDGEYYPKTLSEKAKEAIKMAKIFEKKSEMDLMTEVYNNESFKMHVIEQMKINKANFNLYLFDIDHFKDVNDTYGHLAGDELLKLFSAFLKQFFTDSAIIGRMGGDEFAVYEFCLADKKDIIQKTMLMQKEFGEFIIQKFKKIAVNYSVGIVSPQKQITYEEMYKNADAALYKAKQSGRQTYYWYDS